MVVRLQRVVHLRSGADCRLQVPLRHRTEAHPPLDVLQLGLKILNGFVRGLAIQRFHLTGVDLTTLHLS